MPRPNFFIIGAPKCGTTALVEYLRGHRQALLSVPKEPHYFAPDLPGYREVDSLERYEALFATADRQRWRVGEGSVFYLFSQMAARLTRSYAPEARIIALVRNPLEMIPSYHAQLQYSRDEDEADLEVAWKRMRVRRRGEYVPRHCRSPQLLRYDRIARYGEQLTRWLDAFGPAQVKIVLFDDLRADTDGVYRDVLRFLELPDDGRRGFRPINTRRRQLSNWLADFTERTPPRLVRLALAARQQLGVARWGILDTLRRWNTAPAPPTPLAPWLHSAICEAYAEDVGRLSRLVQRDLSGWLRADAVTSRASVPAVEPPGSPA